MSNDVSRSQAERSSGKPQWHLCAQYTHLYRHIYSLHLDSTEELTLAVGAQVSQPEGGSVEKLALPLICLPRGGVGARVMHSMTAPHYLQQSGELALFFPG